MHTLTLLKSSRFAPFSIKRMATSLCPFITANMTGVDSTWKYNVKTNLYIQGKYIKLDIKDYIVLYNL